MPDLHSGLVSRFRNSVRPADFAVGTMLRLAAACASPSLLAAPLVFILWGWWLLDRIGGISGDGHGAGIEIAEPASRRRAAVGASRMSDRWTWHGGSLEAAKRSEEHTSELQSLMRISYAVFCLQTKTQHHSRT